MAEKPRPHDVIIWTVSQGPGGESFELRTLAVGLLERFSGSWPSALERAKQFAARRGADVWKQEPDSYRRVWTFSGGGL
jgi:hypothetical protein